MHYWGRLSNHFIEVGLDLHGDNWITIHTGSRNFGKCICEYWQGVASANASKVGDSKKKAIDDAKTKYSGKELGDMIKQINSKNEKAGIKMTGLEFLEGDDVAGYLFDMLFAQTYAEFNRSVIIKSILKVLNLNEIDKIETVHNFIDFKDMIIRKGAVRSYAGERFLVPFNMRDGLLICEGMSNPDWNYSAPHGAGRLMSRTEAKKKISLETFKDQMKDVYSTSVGVGTLDEAPDAYKDSKVIEEAIHPTAKIINRVVPFINLKAVESMED